MKSSAPWSVKGIERDARETAKEAAKREGMTVGEWLNQIIYSAGSGEESDGEIEGLKLRDIVKAVEHLNKRIAEADARNADAVSELTRNIGGMVERVQRLERVKPAEGTHSDLAARLEKLEQAGGDRQRIEALKALEKAVAQVAAQFNTAHKTSLERLDANERQLQELAARIDRAGAGDEDASGVGFLKDAIDGLSTRIARAERIASEAAELKAKAGGSADPEFIERTGARLRVLGDEIKRGGDQIRGLETTIAKLSEQIDAAERRSAEGVQKVADTIADLREEFAGGGREISRADIDAAVAAATKQTEERLEALQSSLDVVMTGSKTASRAAPQPVESGETEKPAKIDIEEALQQAFADEERISSLDKALSDDAADEDAPQEAAAEHAEEETAAITEDRAGEEPEGSKGEDPFAFADEIEAAIEETPEETGEEFSFDLDDDVEDDERSNDARALLSEVEEVFGKRKPSAPAAEKELTPEDSGGEDASEPEDELDSILGDLDDITEPPPFVESVEAERAAAKALLIGDSPSLSREFSDETDDEAEDEDFLKAARRRAKEAAERAATERPTRRKLTPKQRAILAARARQKRLAAAMGEAPSPDNEDPLAEMNAPEPEDRADAETKEDDAEERGGFAKALSALRDKLPFIGKKGEESDRRILGEKDADEKLDGDRAAFSTLKTTATARPVTMALGVAIFLAVAALFFLVKDLFFKAPEPRPTRPSITATSPSPEVIPTDKTTTDVPEVPAAPAVDPRALYFEAMTALGKASGNDEVSAAMKKLEEAAALGHPPAQLQLGEFYKTGQGVEQDLGQARTWFRRAANGGNVLAMHRIGVMTARGEGGPADTGEAVGWFELAANRGLVDSQYNLGAIFHPTGGDTPGASLQDAGKAYFWYSLAAKNGDTQAPPLAASVAQMLTPEQKQDLDAKIAAWQPQPVDDSANEMAPAN